MNSVAVGSCHPPAWQLVLVKEGTQKACVVEHEGNEGAFRGAAEEAVPYTLFKGWLLCV